MLKELSLRSFAIAGKTDLVLQPGMTAITGETGAGKSIMVDALNLLTGQKADPSMIMEGENQCTISAVFSADQDPRINQWLQDHGYETDEEVILKRQIKREGKSRNYLNGLQATLTQMRELSEMLLNVCSQHDHISLLKASNQRIMLDRSLEDKKVLREVEGAYSELKRIEQELDAAMSKKASEEAEFQLLNYQLEELEGISPQEGEFEQLSSEQKSLQNATEIIEALGGASQALVEGESTLQDQISSIIRLIEKSGDDHAVTLDVLNGLHSAATEIEEAGRNLSRRLDTVEINPERLEEVNERMSELLNIARKHGVLPDELPRIHFEIAQKIESFTSNSERIEVLQENFKIRKDEFVKLSERLSKARKYQAKDLSKQVTECLKSLGMEKARFEIEVQSHDKVSDHGMDSVEFMFCANVGQTPRPMKDVASGGELSRISLALQIILAKYIQMPVMVFDEVDVGIGGNTAAVVGNMLKSMGTNNQVITITHQAPVAKIADNHVRAEKDHKKDKTITRLVHLDEKGREEEIQRMIGI